MIGFLFFFLLIGGIAIEGVLSFLDSLFILCFFLQFPFWSTSGLASAGVFCTAFFWERGKGRLCILDIQHRPFLWTCETDRLDLMLHDESHFVRPKPQRPSDYIIPSSLSLCPKNVGSDIKVQGAQPDRPPSESEQVCVQNNILVVSRCAQHYVLFRPFIILLIDLSCIRVRRFE